MDTRLAAFFEGCAQLDFGRKVVRFVMRPGDAKAVHWRADLRTRSADGTLSRGLGLDNVSSAAVNVDAALADFIGWAKNHGIVIDPENRAKCALAI